MPRYLHKYPPSRTQFWSTRLAKCACGATYRTAALKQMQDKYGDNAGYANSLVEHPETEFDEWTCWDCQEASR